MENLLDMPEAIENGTTIDVKPEVRMATAKTYLRGKGHESELP